MILNYHHHRNVVGMPHCLNAPVAMPLLPSRNAPISKSQCPNREVAMPHFWTQCPTFLVVVLYIYIYYIILKIIVRLLNAFHLNLFLAAIDIYNIFYIILTSFRYIIACAPVVLVSCGKIYYIYIYMYVYI